AEPKRYVARHGSLSAPPVPGEKGDAISFSSLFVSFGSEPMLSRSELKSLQARREYPSVSILAPTHRTAPSNKQDPIRGKTLVRKAVNRLHGEFGKRDVAAVVKNLQQLVREVDWEHTLDGLALFARREQSAAVNLPFRVKPRAVIDETFAT